MPRFRIGRQGNEQPVLLIHPGVTHRVEHLLVQELCYQSAQAISRCAVQAVTGVYASKRLREVDCGDKAIAQITAASPALIPGEHGSDS